MVAVAALALLSAASLHVATTAASESAYYQIVTIPVPPGIVLEAGGMQMMPDGRVAVCTRYGEIYLVVDGLQEGHVHELHLPGVKSAEGKPLLHPVAYSTLNRVR